MEFKVIDIFAIVEVINNFEHLKFLCHTLLQYLRHIYKNSHNNNFIKLKINHYLIPSSCSLLIIATNK